MNFKNHQIPIDASTKRACAVQTTTDEPIVGNAHLGFKKHEGGPEQIRADDPCSSNPPSQHQVVIHLLMLGHDKLVDEAAL